MSKPKKSNKKGTSKKYNPKSTILSESFFSKRWIDFLIIAVIAFICFSPALNNEFLDFDDRILIYENALVVSGDVGAAFSWNLGTPYYKPIVFLSWIIEKSIFGLNPFVFHLNNVLIHIINCFLAYLILVNVCRFSEFTKNHLYPVVFFTTLLYALHPLHVESIAWAVERKDVLFSLFYLLGFWSYIKYVENKSLKWMGLLAISYLLSMMCKGPGITLIAVIFVYDFLVRREFKWKLVTEKLPVLFVFLIGIWMYGLLFGFDLYTQAVSAVPNQNIDELQVASTVERFLMMNVKMLYWLFHILLPVKLSLAYPRQEYYELASNLKFLHPIITLAMVYGLWKVRSSSRLLLFCAAFFLITLAPAVFRNDLGTAIFVSDRYTYLSSLPILFLMSIGIIWLGQRYFPRAKRFVFFVFIPLTLFYLVTGFTATKTWKNDLTVWSNAIEKYPNITNSYASRGRIYLANNQIEEALKDFNKILEIDPNNVNGLDQRGRINRMSGRNTEALIDLNKAVAIEGDNLSALTNRGNVYRDLNRLDEALRDFNTVLNLNPNYLFAIKNRGSLFGQLRRTNEAITDLDRATEMDPNDKGPFKDKIFVYFQANNFQKALENCDYFLQLDPNNQEVINIKRTLQQGNVNQ